MTTTDPNDFLLGGGGAPGFKFPEIGTVAKGTVVSFEAQQQTDFATGEPKTYRDGNPMMQVVVTMQTDERDPDVEDDDGKRRLFIRGQMRQAVGEAIRAAGAKGLAQGGVLAVQYVADKPSETRGFNPAKQYRAQYQPPSAAQANNALLGESQQQPTGEPVSADSLI